MGKQPSTKRVPSEINWLGNGENISHLTFFNFFKSYNRRRAQSRFLATVKYIENEDKKNEVLDNYTKWRKTKSAKDFWKQREASAGRSSASQQDNADDLLSTTNYTNITNTNTNTTNTTATTTTTSDAIETISLSDAKEIIALGNNEPTSHRFSKALHEFKRDIFGSLDSLLTYESHLQHLLALSNILFIGKNSCYPGLQRYFEEPIQIIRQTMYDSFIFNRVDHKFPMDVLVALITITNDLNCGSLTLLNAETKILALTNNCTDKVLIRLLQCVKSMVESLPVVTQKKEIKEFELCTRFLQPCFQKLFDNDNDEILFKWLNVSCFTDTDIDSSQKRPDGCVENDNKAIGYFEVKPIKHSKNHKKINIDLHRLCTFAKIGTATYKSKYMFQVMAVGTNVQFHISEAIGDILIVSELDSIRLPLSLDELPQLIPYLDRLYNVVEAIHRLCYPCHAMQVNNSFGQVVKPKVIKAIMEKSTDRIRENPFYHPYR
ncbi:hypothetical protein HPULCUR_010004 [Helicostylum pulchrum]|uniref:Uncharacterized protein n=1 Tax=Helicostylum pulchrum TaxID=562976 RepID=A0ABP9YC19_9FUNG